MVKKITLKEQYEDIKKEHKNSLVLFQVGKFYEVRGLDAYIASKILDFKIIIKKISPDEGVPMCGIPIQTAVIHTKTLCDSGCRVVLIKQGKKSYEMGLRIREVEKILEPDDGAVNLNPYIDEYNIYLEEEFKPEAERIFFNPKRELKKLNLKTLDADKALRLLREWQSKLQKKENEGGE